MLSEPLEASGGGRHEVIGERVLKEIEPWPLLPLFHLLTMDGVSIFLLPLPIVIRHRLRRNGTKQAWFRTFVATSQGETPSKLIISVAWYSDRKLTHIRYLKCTGQTVL